MNSSKSISKVSIIMPTFNRSQYILETIESIRHQTYSNWELIVIDDGSDDNTEELIIGLKDDKIRYYKTRHAGMRNARSVGLEKITSSLIAFIDSDDVWAINKLEKQVNAIEQNPDAGFCLTGGFNFRDINKPLEYFYDQREGLKYGDLFISFFKSELATFTSALLIRRKCIQFTGNFNELKSPTHVDFILRLAKNFKGIILYEPLLYRKLHNSNYSSVNWNKRSNEGIKLIRSYKDSVPAGIYSDCLYKSHINFGEKCLANKKRSTAIRHFFMAWKYKPMSIVPVKKMIKAFIHFFKD